MNLKQSIVLVEDDEALLESLQTVLTEEGYGVESFSQGKDVIDFVIRNQPQVIIMDVKLPDAWGDEITYKLKSNTATHNIPVLLISANEDVDRKAAQCGADEFLTKPFSIDDLLSSIENLVSGFPIQKSSKPTPVKSYADDSSFNTYPNPRTEWMSLR